MRESNTLVSNVCIKQLLKATLINTKDQYMIRSNILVHNVIIKLLQRVILKDTKEEFMKG